LVSFTRRYDPLIGPAVSTHGHNVV
jgi:hypothetical protein